MINHRHIVKENKKRKIIKKNIETFCNANLIIKKWPLGNFVIYFYECCVFGGEVRCQSWVFVYGEF